MVKYKIKCNAQIVQNNAFKGVLRDRNGLLNFSKGVSNYS